MINSKPNICILNISMSSGGAEKVISLLLKELKKDFNVTLIILYDVIHFPIPEEVDVVVLSKDKGLKSSFIKFFNFIVYTRKYLKVISKKEAKIAISFLALPNFMNSIAAIFNKGLVTIISERGFPTDNTTSKLSYKISKLFYPILYNRCSKLFSNSVHINRDLKENFSVKIPMAVIYNPIELPTRVMKPESLNNDNEVLNVITAGTINKRKNHIMILRALVPKASEYKLTILGEGPLKSYITQQITQLKLEQSVSLLGNVKDVNGYFLNNDCFVLSSFTEGFPNALLEALAVGLPCISSNCLSGPLEMLNENKDITINKGDFHMGKYGLLVNNDDSEGLHKALEFFRTNPQEREKYSQLSLKRAEAYKLDNIYSKFYQFLIS